MVSDNDGNVQCDPIHNAVSSLELWATQSTPFGVEPISGKTIPTQKHMSHNVTFMHEKASLSHQHTKVLWT